MGPRESMFYLIRHGQTEYNVQRRLQGGSDSPLTPVGIQQARNVGHALRKIIGDAGGWILESSPLPRARATAEIVREMLDPALPLRVDDRLREVSLGSWEGLTDEEIEKGWPSACIKESVRRAWAYHCPDGETLESARARLTDWLSKAEGSKRIAVTHGIAGSIIRGIFAGLAEEQVLRLPVENDLFFELHNRTIRSFSASGALERN